MSTRLFGTDGVRGTPGEPPLDERTLARLGAAVVRMHSGAGASVQVLIGRDTRESGDWITAQLARGIESETGSVTDGGLLSTPAVAFLTRDGEFDAGIVVSASHNPFRDNGVKVITGDGEKADDDLEARITALVTDETWAVPDTPVPSVESIAFSESYIAHTSRILNGVTVPADLRIAIDCANGATSQLAPAVLRGLGLDPIVLHDRPDGRNINLDCGSPQPARRARVMELAQRISLEKNRQRIGRVIEVMLDEPADEPGVFVGRSYADSPGIDGVVRVVSDGTARAGEIVKVRVTGADVYDLEGETVS